MSGIADIVQHIAIQRMQVRMADIASVTHQIKPKFYAIVSTIFLIFSAFSK